MQKRHGYIVATEELLPKLIVVREGEEVGCSLIVAEEETVIDTGNGFYRRHREAGLSSGVVAEKA